MYGIAERFRIDPAELEKRHQALQSSLHPDRHVGKPASERRLAEQYTATLNAAHVVLGDDLLRAAYLLGLRGCDPFDETTGNRQLPVDFLERQMELRETLDELAGDADPQALAEFTTRLQQEIAAEFAALAQLLDDAPEQVEPAVAAVLRLRYLQNCATQATALASRD